MISFAAANRSYQIGDRCPDTLGASYERGTTARQASNTLHANLTQRREPSREALAAFACGAKLDWPDNLSLSEGADVNSTPNIQKSEASTLIEKTKAEIKKRSEAKAKRILLKHPRRLTKRHA